MTKFIGELSSKTQKEFLHEETKLKLTVFLIIACILCVPIIYSIITIDYIYAVAIAPLIVFVVGGVMPPPKSKYWLVFPNEVFIDDDGIEAKNEKVGYYRQIEDIKNIVDYGDWYLFNFYFPNKNRFFICQKDLIVKGTIEEFENLFRDKIIKK